MMGGATPEGDFERIPNEVLEQIAKYLKVSDLLNLKLTSKALEEDLAGLKVMPPDKWQKKHEKIAQLKKQLGDHVDKLAGVLKWVQKMPPVTRCRPERVQALHQQVAHLSEQLHKEKAEMAGCLAGLRHQITKYS